jgi:hypothetical protein
MSVTWRGIWLLLGVITVLGLHQWLGAELALLISLVLMAVLAGVMAFMLVQRDQQPVDD